MTRTTDNRDADGNGFAGRGDRSRGSAGAAAGERPVLITGGAGFIGVNMAARLLGRGRQVVILDNLSRPGVEENAVWLRERFHGDVHLHIGDITDRGLVAELVSQADQIFHFAAQVAVTTSLADPYDDFRVNLQGTLLLLEAMRALKRPPALLFTSTNKVYGNLADMDLERRPDCYQPRDAAIQRYGVAETQPLDFHSPYGCSKGAADQYVIDYARMYDLPTIVFRMSCIYGRHQFGTEDQGWVAHFLLQALRSEKITLYGDGRQVRDILFADDLIDAMLLAMERLPRTRGRAFNIGGGPSNAVSLLQLIDAVGRLHGQPPEVEYGPWRKGDQPYYVSDTRAFQRTTGWSPRVAARDGIRQLYEWLAANRVPENLTCDPKEVRL